MPKQVPPYKIGLYDGYIYYKIGNKYYVRKHVVPAKKERDPFVVTLKDRTNDAFAVAAKTTALLLGAFESYTHRIGRGKLRARMHSALQLSLGADSSSEKPVAMDRVTLQSLQNFQWSKKHRTPPTIRGKATITIDRKKGHFELYVSSIATQDLKRRAMTATHFRIQAVLGAFDFSAGRYITASDETGLLSFKERQTGDFLLSAVLAEKPGKRLQLLGIGFRSYIMVNEKEYELVEDAGFEIVDV